MKLIKKDTLEYKNGYLVALDNIISIPHPVAEELNHLERCLQRASHESRQPDIVSMQAKAFKFKSMFGTIEVSEPETPTLKQAMEESIGCMEDIAKLEKVKDMKKYLMNIPNLVQFVKNEYVVSTDAMPMLLDLPTIGNPCELTEANLLAMVEAVVTCSIYISVPKGI